MVAALSVPLQPGVPLAAVARALDLPDAALVGPLLPASLEQRDGRVQPRGEELSPQLRRADEALAADLVAGSFQAPEAGRLRELGVDPAVLAALHRAGRVLRLSDQVVLATGADTAALDVLRELPQPFSVSEARAALGSSRRVVLPLLAHLDRTGGTLRLADDRRRVRADRTGPVLTGPARRTCPRREPGTGARTQSPPVEGAPVSNDAIVMLKDDHKEILAAFKKFEAAGDGAHKTKGALVDRIIELLTVHTYIENEIMYPRVRELVPELEDDVLESYEEHHVADVLVMELSAMAPEDERFTAKATVLIENVRHHIEEEEDEWFPKVREALGPHASSRRSVRRWRRAGRPRRGGPRSPARSRRRSTPSSPEPRARALTTRSSASPVPRARRRRG